MNSKWKWDCQIHRQELHDEYGHVVYVYDRIDALYDYNDVTLTVGIISTIRIMQYIDIYIITRDRRMILELINIVDKFLLLNSIEDLYILIINIKSNYYLTIDLDDCLMDLFNLGVII